MFPNGLHLHVHLQRAEGERSMRWQKGRVGANTSVDNVHSTANMLITAEPSEEKKQKRRERTLFGLEMFPEGIRPVLNAGSDLSS